MLPFRWLAKEFAKCLFAQCSVYEERCLIDCMFICMLTLAHLKLLVEARRTGYYPLRQKHMLKMVCVRGTNALPHGNASFDPNCRLVNGMHS
jgi:hypothetical protein